jgi:hypothetical protein
MQDSTPGTVRLFDESGEYLGGASAVVLVPPPTTDPTDPLRWTKNRKRIQLACLVMYVYLFSTRANAQVHAYDNHHVIGS